MARIEFSEGLFEDFERFREDLESHEVSRSDAAARIHSILRAIGLLAQSPSLGRPAGRGRRELLIGRKSRSDFVLYRYVPELEFVIILAARHHAEDGSRQCLATELATPNLSRPRRSSSRAT